MRSPSSIASCQLCQPLFAFTRQRIFASPSSSAVSELLSRTFGRKIEMTRIIIQHRPWVLPRHRKVVGSCKGWNFPIRCMRVCECVDKARQGAKCTLRSAETAAGGEARTRNVTVCSRWLQQRQRRRYSTWSSSSWHICAFDKHGKRREMNQKQSRPTPHTRFPLPKQQTSRCVGWVKKWGH